MEESSDNYYLNIMKKYPLAWEVIKKTANLKASELYFQQIEVPNENFIQINSTLIAKRGNYDQEAIEPKSIGLITDSFKFLSRNFEKVLKTIQYLLERNSAFITFNYYLSNGYISTRKKLLKLAHGIAEIPWKYKLTKDISSKHKKGLEVKKKFTQISFLLGRILLVSSYY